MTLHRKLHIYSCENSWCDLYVDCKGHDITAEYSTVTDIGSVSIDGNLAFIGGDGILDGVVAIIQDLFADESKYFVDVKEYNATLKRYKNSTPKRGKEL